MANDGENDVLDVLNRAADGLDEGEEEGGSKYRWHERVCETTTVRAVLKRYKEKKFLIPLCQRLYVWNKEQRAKLLKSIRKNYSCGSLDVCENETGTQYLTDGLQRLTSLFYLSIDHDNLELSKEEKKMVLDYCIRLETTKGMSDEEVKEYFLLRNSGVALASIVKERSKLSPELNNAVLAVASHSFFRTLNDDGNIQTTSMFCKSHHHEIISMNALLASAHVEMGDNKAKTLCKNISDYYVDVLEHVAEAQSLIDRIAGVYKNLADDIAKRSLNANYIGALLYVMTNKDVTDTQIVDLTCYIYAGKRPKEEYATTTRSNAADAKNVIRRYELLCKWIDNPPMQEFNEQEFHTWLKKYNGKSITNHTGDISVDFANIGDDERKGLYIAARSGKWGTFDEIMSKYKETE